LDRRESVFSYSQAIARQTHSQENVLFLPVSDPDFFVPPSKSVAARRGAYRYNQKYVHVHGGVVPAEFLPYPEITRDQVGSQSREEIRSVFQRIERLYVFENTALSIEAALCGCVVVLIPNEWFSEVIAFHELGMAGMAWGNLPEEIVRAQRTVPLFRSTYLRALEKVPASLAHFVRETQLRASEAVCKEPIDLSFVTIGVGRETKVNWITARSLAQISRPGGRSLRPLGVRAASIRMVLGALRIVGLYEEARWLYRRVRRWGAPRQPRSHVLRDREPSLLFGLTRRRRLPESSRGELPPHVV
jgi:hypothetical protein